MFGGDAEVEEDGDEAAGGDEGFGHKMAGDQPDERGADEVDGSGYGPCGYQGIAVQEFAKVDDKPEDDKEKGFYQEHPFGGDLVEQVKILAEIIVFEVFPEPGPAEQVEVLQEESECQHQDE